MNLSDKVFGSNVDSDIQDIFKDLQKGSFEVNPNQGIKPSPHTHYLGDRVPFARMWAAVNIRESGHEDKDSKNTVYIINDNREDSYDETTVHDSVLKHELTNNQYLKPPAGITGINSKSEGAVGALRRTTVDFVVHNKVDFENIFLPFFLRPGTTVFVDFGWSDKELNLYNPLTHIDNADLKMSTFYQDIYDSEKGELVKIKNKGMMSTLSGQVTKYDVTVDEMGSFKCNLEFVSSNYVLLDKQISEDNDLKFLFTSVMDEFLVGYVARSLGEGNIDMTGNDTYEFFDTKLLRKLNETEADEFTTAFFDEKIKASPGVIDSESKKVGVFFQNLAEDDDNYLDEKEMLYISFGLFEDLFLNNFISQWVETTEEGGETSTVAKPDDIYGLKFTSVDSWVRFDPDLFKIQKTPLREKDEVPSYLYPDSWDIKNGESETSNKIKPKLHKDTNDDITKKRIPLRELFISVPVIQEAFTQSSNLNEALLFIFNKIFEDSTNIINIKMISHNDSQKGLAFQDVNLTGDIIPEEPMLTFDLTSGNTVVLNSDLKFETPKAGLSSMIAIKNTQKNNIFENLDDLKLSFLNILDTTPNTGNKKMIIKSLPDIGFVPEKKKTIDVDLKKIFDSMTPGTILNTHDPNAEKINNNPVSQRYYTYITEQHTRINEIIEEEKKAKGEKSVDDEEFKDLPTETADGKPIIYLHSDRDALLTKAKLKNFLYTNENSIAPILPVTLSLTIYGNNFLSIGDYINVNFLPKRWQDRVFFQIIGVDNSVDTNIWKTTYTTVMRIKPQKKVHLTGNQKSNINSDVVTKYHPLATKQEAEEIADESTMSNELDSETVIDKTIPETIELKILDHIKKGSNFREKSEKDFEKWVKDKVFGFKTLLLQPNVSFSVNELGYNALAALAPNKKNNSKIKDRSSKDIMEQSRKMSALGLQSELAERDIGQLAWVLTVSDFILGDKYLDWSKYQDSEHGDMTLVNGSIGINIKKKLHGGMYGDIPKDMIYFNGIYHSTRGGDDIRSDFQELILNPMDDKGWSGGLDDTQTKILNYIEKRKLFTPDSYILNRIKANPGNSFAKKVYQDGVSPILMSVIFGKAGRADFSEGGGGWQGVAETFVRIKGNWPDFKCINGGNLLIPKRILKETNYEKLVTSLLEDFLKHYMALRKLVPNYYGGANEETISEI